MSALFGAEEKEKIRYAGEEERVVFRCEKERDKSVGTRVWCVVRIPKIALNMEGVLSDVCISEALEFFFFPLSHGFAWWPDAE